MSSLRVRGLGGGGGSGGRRAVSAEEVGRCPKAYTMRHRGTARTLSRALLPHSLQCRTFSRSASTHNACWLAVKTTGCAAYPGTCRGRQAGGQHEWEGRPAGRERGGSALRGRGREPPSRVPTQAVSAVIWGAGHFAAFPRPQGAGTCRGREGRMWCGRAGLRAGRRAASAARALYGAGDRPQGLAAKAGRTPGTCGTERGGEGVDRRAGRGRAAAALSACPSVGLCCVRVLLTSRCACAWAVGSRSPSM